MDDVPPRHQPGRPEALLPKQDDISSTEKLLDVIRNTTQVYETPLIKPSISKNKLIHFIRKLSMKPTPTVGVEITRDCLHLVKVGKRADNTPMVLDFRSVPLLPGITESRDKLIDLLRTELAGFHPSPPQASVWTALSIEETDIRSLRIPKVPKSKLEKAVYWTYQKEATAELDKLIIDYRVLGDVIDNGVAKIEVVLCTAPRLKIEAITAMFREAGVELAGIVSLAFGLQNFLKTGWLGIEENLACSLLIDFNWSRIDVFRPNGDLIISRGIKAGISSMVESIRSEVARPMEDVSVSENLNKASPVLEIPVFNSSEADRILQILCTDAPSRPLAASDLLKSDDVFNMVLPALERLIRQVERTLEHVTLRFSDGPIQKMFISGAINAYPRLVRHIGDQLGLPHETVDPFALTSGSLALPESEGERAAYTSTVGIALSGGGHPPNFLFTHKENTLKQRKSRLHLAILFFFLVGAAAIWGDHLIQKQVILELETSLYSLDLSAAPEGMENDRASLLALAERVNKKNQGWKTFSRNYLPVAVIGEITSLAPDHIEFIRIGGTGWKPLETEQDEDGEESTATTKATATVDAVVHGRDTGVESKLARYLMALKRSSLFSRVSLKKKTVERLGSEDALRFTLYLEGA